MKRKIIAAALAVFMVFTELPGSVYGAEVINGAEGNGNLTLENQTENGTATDTTEAELSSEEINETDTESGSDAVSESGGISKEEGTTESESPSGKEAETETEEEAESETEEKTESGTETEQTVTEFAQIEEPVIAMKEKLPLEEAIEQLPDTLEVYVEEEDDWTDIPVTWECVDDYDQEDQSSFVFVPTPASSDTGVDETKIREEDLPKMEIYYDNVYTAIGGDGLMAVSRTLSDSSVIMEELEEESEAVSVSSSARGISVSSDEKEFWESLDNDDCHAFTTAQKRFFSTLDTNLNAYLYNGKVASEQVVEYTDGSSTTFSCTSFMSYDTSSFNNDGAKFMSGDDPSNIQSLTSVYLFSHPQYFFVTTSFLTTDSGKIAINFLPDFVDTESRKAAAEEIKENITGILEKVGGGDQDILYSLHNEICKRVSYDTKADMYNDRLKGQSDWIPGNTMYDQSMASVFFGETKTTVCAGYSQSYAALCNAAGIPAFSVISLTHQWNKVKIGDYWYTVDVTWDDGGMDGATTKDYYLKSDATIMGYSDFAKEHHTLNGYWSSFLSTTPTEYSYYDAAVISFFLDGKGTLNGLENPSYVFPVGVGIPSSEFSGYIPESSDYDFLAWYRDKEYKKPIPYVSQAITTDLEVYAKWQQIYTISYITNGGTLQEGSPEKYNGVNPSAPTFDIPDPEKEGYTFLNWYRDGDPEKPVLGSSYAVDAGNRATIVISKLREKLREESGQEEYDGNLELSAIWSYGTVQYDANVDDASEVTGQTLSGVLPGGSAPEESIAAADCGFLRAGYEFVSWNTEPNGNGTPYSSGASIPAASITSAENSILTLYAQWKPAGLTVTYDPAGGVFASGVESKIVVAAKGSFSLPSQNAVTKAGYILSGWVYTDPSTGKQTVYSPGKSVKNTAASGEWTLSAKWKEISYSINYQLEGGTNSSLNPKSFSVEDGDLRLYKPSKSYHTFDGWSYEKDGDQITDFSANELAKRADAKNKVTLYALYTPYTYRVIYHMNAGDTSKLSSAADEPVDPVDGETDFMGKKAYTQTVSYGVSSAYYSGFQREGFKLSSWNTRSDGRGTKYTPGASFKNLSATDGGIIDLYAQWTSSSGSESYRIAYYETGDVDGTPSYGTTGELASGGRYTFYKGAVKAGYTLSSWQYVSADGKTKKTFKPGAVFTDLKTSLKLTGNDPVKLTAVWSLNSYKITYANMTGAKQDTRVNLSSYTVCDKRTGVENVINLATPVKAGYEFLGWYQDEAMSDSKRIYQISSSNVDTMAVKNRVTIYAKWEPIGYTVKYYAQILSNEDAGFVELTEKETAAEYGKKYDYESAPTRPGYTFAGWTKDNKGTKYKAGAKYSNLSQKKDDTVKMYAQWTTATYKLTYDLRNGNSNGGNPTTYKLSTKAFTLKEGRRDFADFLGWYESEGDAKRAEILEDEALIEKAGIKRRTEISEDIIADWIKSGNHTLYAAWKCNKSYCLWFMENTPSGDSGGKIPDETVNYGDFIYMPDVYADTGAAISRTGYTFLGWSINRNAKSATYTKAKAYKNLTSTKGATVVLYGVWKEKPRTISYSMNGGKKYSNTKTESYSYPTSFPLVTDSSEEGFYTRISPAKRTGYRFMGWFYDAGFQDSLTKEGEFYLFQYTESNTAVKLYAKWEASYSVYFDKNGGVFKDGTEVESEEAQKGRHKEPQEVGAAFKMPGTDLVSRKGYTLLGWATKASAASAAYNLTKEYKNLKSKDGESITLYAVWKPIAITYDLKGGSRKKNAVYPSKYEGSRLTIPAPERSGYTFTGWYLSPDFDEDDKLGEVDSSQNTVFDPASDNSLQGDVKLYAGWEPCHYTVRYWVNIDEYEKNCQEDGTLKPEAEWILNESVMKKADRLQSCDVGAYYFSSTRAVGLGEALSEWCYETRSGTRTKTVKLTPGGKFKDLTKEDGGVVDVWGIWKPVSIEKGVASADASASGSGKITLTCDLGSLPAGTPLYPAALNRNTGDVEYLLDTDLTDSGVTSLKAEEDGSLSVELLLTAETPDDGLGLTDHSYKNAYAVTDGSCASDPSSFVRLHTMSLGAAIQKSDGSYEAVTNAAYVKHPEELSSTALFQTTQTKKGIQIDDEYGMQVALNEGYNMDHAFVNLRVANLYLGGPFEPGDPGYASCNFGYNGKGYLFNKEALEGISRLNQQKKCVTAQLLLEHSQMDPATGVWTTFPSAALVHSKADKKGYKFYSWEDTDKTARETIEALAVWLGRACGNSGCYVSNWILGNEVNSHKAWQYSGSMTKDEFFRSYAETMHIFYNGIRSTNREARFFVCADNNWNRASYGYSSKAFLDTFHSTIDAMDSTMEWGIAFHPYAYPLTSTSANTFWRNTGVNHTDASTYVNMSNLEVLINHSRVYTGDNTVPDIILTELGYTPGSITPTAANENLQAAALIYSYAIAANNSDIDAFIIRSLNQTAEKPYLGIASDISNPANVIWRKAGALYAACNRMETAQSVINALDDQPFATIWKTVNSSFSTFSQVLSRDGISPTVFY